MIKSDVIKKLGFDRAISVPTHEDYAHLSESQQSVLSDIKYFGIDKVYFSTDTDSNSYPSIFLKEVDSFNSDVLFEITNIHRLIWNYKKVLFFYVYSDTEIRIYNCSEKPLIITEEKKDLNSELKKIELKSYEFKDERALEELSNLFSTISVDSGVIWTIEEAYTIREKINLQRRVDKYLVKSLINTAKQLQSEGLGINAIHKIIMRSLFLLYLEDRGATDEKFYSQIKNGAKSYFDILDNDSDTYTLFNKLQEHFNGNVFTIDEDEQITVSQLKLIKKCFISGNDDNYGQIQLFDNWRLFDFSIIQIELLSEIYENFLSEINPELKQKTGTYYTPPSLVELILNEKLPVSKQEKKYRLKVLDPSCGSGIFLVQSFKRLVKRYENKHGKKLTDFNILKKILLENIYGIEIHPQSIKVTAFSLYLALVDNLNPKTLWQNKDYRLPYLINNPDDLSLKKQGSNLYCRDTIDTNEEIENIEFDLVVGNPPFGTKDLLPSIRNYCNKYGFAKEMVLPFLHKSIKFSPNGEIALIFNTKVLTNTGSTYSNFRQWIFNDCYVEKVYNFSILRNAKKNFGGQLFGSATGPISIVYYRNNPPENKSDKVIYYAPKTYIKSNVIEGVSIDPTDVKYIPRVECQKKDTSIWKIAMWGSLKDLEFLKRLIKKHPSIKGFLKKESIDYGVGFELSSPNDKLNTEIKNLPIHTPKNIDYYYTPVPSKRIENIKFRRLGKQEAYMTQHILLNEGVKVNEVTNSLSVMSSFVEYKSAYTKGIVGVFSRKDDFDTLKILTLYLNSSFIKYFAFLTTSSWGIERDVVKHKELFQAPYILSNIDQKTNKKLLNLFNQLLKEKKEIIQVKSDVEEQVQELIFNNFSRRERFIVDDLINNIDLFHKGEKSRMLLPVVNVKNYSEVILNELNNFLSGQNIYANITTYEIHRFSPLMMIKVSFESSKKEIFQSDEDISNALKKIDKHLWEKKSTNIYFRKKLNYKRNDSIYLIRPNQRRFWSEAIALDDAEELILEILNGI
ncbi:Eco57I restriction-modification methylase domain-containing protein [Tenacibaculum discolor]|uniref:Eco57I restriction-modification methylase domain-containing protein n=1 Tax=Tenacibaculum discolor TaxID=361581 RepID=UPI000EB42D30|nr:N-6 DNA methylase [Tenacibaculum discolor]RLK06700.1 type I restriction-modification system DNA methylase subunit [Tenacibaculum discolor]